MDTALLNDLFTDKLLGKFGEKNGRHFARLKETDKGEKLKQIDIFDVPEGSVLINLDKAEPPHSLFKKGKGKCRRCDYVLITKTKYKHIMLFIEMKSAKRVPVSDVKKQFWGAECVIDYCNATLKRFHDQTDFFGKYEKRFVVFYKPSISKKTTRLPRKISHGKITKTNDKPEDMLKYRAPINPSLRSLIL